MQKLRIQLKAKEEVALVATIFDYKN